MNNTQLVSRELDRAREKHPHFVDIFARDPDPENAQSRLRSIRNVLRDAVDHRETTFPLVLQCEVREATAAHAAGDYGAAIVELAQCAAVCIRAMDHVRETRRKLLDVKSCWAMQYVSDPDKLFPADGVIATGEYRGVPYLVLNRSGRHPCAYIDIENAVEKPPANLKSIFSTWNGACPHGGWSYDNIGVPGCNKENYLHRWIGWDYNHVGDFDAAHDHIPGKRWTTEEIVEEIMDVVDTLCAAGVFRTTPSSPAHEPHPCPDRAAEPAPSAGEARADCAAASLPRQEILAIERTVRDAIISYAEQYPLAGSTEAEKEIVARANFANDWLKRHGLKPEEVVFSREETPCL